MKKIAFLAVPALLALALSACGNNAAQAQEEKDAKTLDSLTTVVDSSVQKIKTQTDELKAAVQNLGTESTPK